MLLSVCDAVLSFAGIRKSSVLKKLASYGDELDLSDLSASLKDVTGILSKIYNCFMRTIISWNTA